MTPCFRELENSHSSPETQLASSHTDSRSSGKRSTCWHFASSLLEGLACLAHRPVTGTLPLYFSAGPMSLAGFFSQPLTVQRPGHSGESRAHHRWVKGSLYPNSTCISLQRTPLGSFPSFLSLPRHRAKVPINKGRQSLYKQELSVCFFSLNEVVNLLPCRFSRTPVSLG